jgi:hypothetical protein
LLLIVCLSYPDKESKAAVTHSRFKQDGQDRQDKNKAEGGMMNEERVASCSSFSIPPSSFLLYPVYPVHPVNFFLALSCRFGR